jgi:hypothetical protein
LDASVDADAGAPDAQPCSVDVTDSGVPGVRIQIDGDRCSFAYRQGGLFRYRITLDRDLSYRVEEGTSCGRCGGYSDNLKPLVRASVFGNGGSYCADCDVGCCPPDRAATHTLKAQSFDGVLDWPARAWNGPSDTSAPLGAYFTAGQYKVMVQVQLPGWGLAHAELPISIE